MIGSMAAGKLYEIWNGHRIIFVAMVFCAVGMAIVPAIPFLWLLLTLNFVLAFIMAFVDVGNSPLFSMFQ